MPSEVSLQTTLNRTIFQTLPSVQKVYVLIHVAPTGEAALGQMPLNFGLVLDRSGSMAGDKINKLREAVKLALGQMGAQDLISVVLFDDKVDVLVPSQPLTDGTRLQSQVGQIVDRGGTSISKGMRKGLDEIRRGIASNRVSRMLLLTDGETYGDEEQCKQIAQECGAAGVPITALGLGDEWNSELLDAIAQQSGGQSDQLVAPDQIVREFQQTISSMQGTVAKNANLTLRLVAGVTPAAAWRVLPQISRLDARSLSDRDVQIALGDLERGVGQSVLVELVVQPKPAGSYRIAQVDVSYDLLAGATGEHVRQDILLALTDNQAQVGPFNPDVMNLVEKVSVFKLQTRALSEAQAGNIGMATQQLRAAATRLLNLGEVELAQAAQQEAANLEQQGQMSAAGTKKLHYGTRKLTQRLDDLS